jgi:hypothetical protein
MIPALIEILQDGAALLGANSLHSGILTRKVQSCAVHAFLGTRGSLFVHDTGQLSTNSIKNLIDKCGRVTRTFSVMNDVMMKPGGLYEELNGENRRNKQLELHARRRREIRTKANISVAWELIPAQGSDMAIYKNGRIVVNPGDAYHPVPESNFREAVLILNNLFSPSGAEQIKVDLQFRDGAFTLEPTLLRSEAEMLGLAEIHALRGDRDYLTILAERAIAFRRNS